MQSTSIPWQVVWVLVSASFVLGGLAALLKGIYPKPIGTAPHCPKCGYRRIPNPAVAQAAQVP